MDGFKIIQFDNVNNNIKLPFIVCIPNNLKETCNLILNGITPDICTNKKDQKYKGDGSFRDSLEEALRVAYTGEFSPVYKKLALDYGNPILIPIIPRCMGLYTGFLGYDVWHENYDRAINGNKEGWSGFTKKDLDKFRKLDYQICLMINYTIDYLKKNYSVNVDDKVIATGYSASSKFVNFFSALHPDKVKMIIGGGTGGLCIYPNLEYTYPLGFKDIGLEKLELFKNILQFYFIGKEDQQDPSRPMCESIIDSETNRRIPILKNGKLLFIKSKETNQYILPDGGYYSLEQTKIIHDKISSDVQERFEKNSRSYYSANVNCIFKKYNGDHEINDSNLLDDIINFYETKNNPNLKISL